MIAVILGSASTLASEVNRRREGNGTPEQIWSIAGSWCGIKDWHPDVSACREDKEGDTVVRIITLKDGKTIKDKLMSAGNLNYTYKTVESPFTVKNLSGRFWVAATEEDPRRSDIHWDAEFDDLGANANEQVVTFFRDGLVNLQKISRLSQEEVKPSFQPSSNSSRQENYIVILPSLLFLLLANSLIFYCFWRNF